MYWTPKETRQFHLDVQIKGVTEPAETGGAPLVRMLSTHRSLLSRLGSRRRVTALGEPDLRTTCFFGRILEPLLLPFFRLCSSARESPFGEVPAVGRTVWGWGRRCFSICAKPNEGQLTAVFSSCQGQNKRNKVQPCE